MIDASRAIDAQMTLNFDRSDRKIISLEKFSNSLKSVDCGETMKFEFNDAASFADAKTKWNWVDQASENEFILVANDDRCSPEERFGLWLVSGLDIDDAALTISATATQTNWKDSKDAASEGSRLQVSSRSVSGAVARRQDLDLNSDFTGLIADSAFLGISQPRVTLDCTNCKTTGTIDFDFDVGLNPFNPSFSLSVKPRGVTANVELALGIGGNLTDPKTFTKELLPPLALAGFDIPLIATFGPSLTVDAGAEFTITGEAELKFGARVEVSDDSEVKIEVNGDGVSDDGANGWDSTVEAIGPELSAQIDATASIFTSVGLKLEASVFDFGFEASLDLRAPEFRLTATAEASTEGVCDTNQALGVGLKLEAGVNLVFSAGFAGEDPIISPTLFEKLFPLFETCQAFGPEIGSEEPHMPSSRTKRRRYWRR